MLAWSDLIELANCKLRERSLGAEYHERLQFELTEIEKQGAGRYWLDLVNNNKRFDKNPKYLLLPWLLGLTIGPADVDPIKARPTPVLNTVKASKVSAYLEKYSQIPLDFIKDHDMPDIDIDCLPSARDPIKLHAMATYGQGFDDGYGPVCSVGTWQTYKFKSGIIDACDALGTVDKKVAQLLTANLPEEVDDLKEYGEAVCKGKFNGDDCGQRHALSRCPRCGSPDTDGRTLGQLLDEYEELREFEAQHKDIIAYAVRLVGRIRNMGMHAGALIISNNTLYGNVPLAKSSKKGYWVSMWSEGRNTQLSKLGYVKFDLLGLKTLQYIFECCELIYSNRNIKFGSETTGHLAMDGWDDIDPELGTAGHFFDNNGEKHFVYLNDPDAIEYANDIKVDAIFQFDTDLAKSILANGVKSFNDLLLYNAMGHPGPMQCVRSDSKINTIAGKVPINELCGQEIMYAAQNGVKFTSNYEVFGPTEKDTLSLELDDGVVHNVSADHQFYTKRGYVRAEELNDNDEILYFG